MAAKKPPAQYKQRSVTVTVPAPYGGWNARDALTAMPPSDAVVLDNWIPAVTNVSTRKGYITYATGVGTRVDTLMPWSGPSSSKLFAASSGGKIMECVSTSTATNTATATYSNGKFQQTMIGTPAGNYLFICNGADKPYTYDGTNWTTASITGCTAGSTTFVNVAIHQSRLWLAQLNTLDAWFLGVASIAGAATRLQLGPFCKRGGYLLAIASWTRDGGSGPDDILVFITSRGEAILYSGTDPTSANTFQLVGVFNTPIAIGKRCFTQVGADLALITSEGILPLSNILPLSPGGAGQVAATAKISGAYQAAYQNGSAMFGWQVIENAREQLLVVNVPTVENTTTVQFVMNTLNGSWCRFTGLPAQCWATLGDQLYFGGTDGKVYLYGASLADNGATAISSKLTTAFQNGGNAQTKQFLMARPVVVAPDGLIPGVATHIDYDTTSIVVPSESFTTSGTLWDTALWDTFSWAGGSSLTAQWQTINGVGVAAALDVQVISTEAVTVNSIDVMYEVGGNL